VKNLLLMRHGESPQARNDKQRTLSDLGKQQCAAMTQTLEGLIIAEVLSSDYLRAIESAENIFPSENLNINRLLNELLRPMSEPKAAFNYILDRLEKIPEHNSLLVVCHMPIVAELAALAIDGKVNDRFSFPLASIMSLQCDLPAQGCFDLLWHKNP